MNETILIEEHRKLKAKLAPFGGWLMPIQYSSILTEHQWTRSSCSLFDICHMGEFMIYGESQRSNLQKIITANLKSMKVFSCRYGFMLNEQGRIIDDVIVYKIKEDQWMLVVNAATVESDQVHLREYLSSNARFENISDKLAKLDLQGPLSRDVLNETVGDNICTLEYYRFGYFSLLGQDVIISRTGYTGELGFELYINNEKAVELWRLLLTDERVKPAGLGARDTLRLEVGYPLYGQDIDIETTPFEAGLEKFVDFDKDFIGKDDLIREQDMGAGKSLCGFISSTRRAPRHNYKIFIDTQEVGIVTSGSFSPSLSCGIGMGYIDPEYNKAGTKIVLRGPNVEIEAAIAQRPFYKKGTVRD